MANGFGSSYPTNLNDVLPEPITTGSSHASARILSLGGSAVIDNSNLNPPTMTSNNENFCEQVLVRDSIVRYDETHLNTEADAISEHDWARTNIHRWHANTNFTSNWENGGAANNTYVISGNSWLMIFIPDLEENAREVQ